MLNPEMSMKVAQERRRDELAAVAHDRLIAACAQDLSLPRRAARPVGHALFSLGTWLLRYGKVEIAPQIYRPSAGSVKLN